MENKLQENNTHLINELRDLINQSRNKVAIAVNSAITLLYWQIGKRVNEEIQGKNRSEIYGREIVATVWRQLSKEYGTAFFEKNLRRIMQFAKVFPDEEHVELLQLGNSNIKIAEYFTKLPNMKLLGQKLHHAIEIARNKAIAE